MFGGSAAPAKQEGGDESDGAVVAEEEAPIYAEAGDGKVEFKKGVEI